MEVYDNRYFVVNKKPNDPRKLIAKTIVLILMFILTVPNMIGLVVHFHDMDMLMEQLHFILVMMVKFMKIFRLGIAEKQSKMKSVHVSLAENWIMITGKDEKGTLPKYSEIGRTITIFYTAYLLSSFITFVTPPAIPVILNIINPSPEPRPLEYSFESEFPLDDNDAHHLEIYIWDVLYMPFVVVPPIACDSIYSVVNEHCLASYSIVQYRLSKLRKMIDKDSTNARSGCHEPGQKILNFSTSLMDYAYESEWYEATLEMKKILRLSMLKRMKPSLLSAGGLIELNFTDYVKIVKTAASYITVFSSFRWYLYS